MMIFEICKSISETLKLIFVRMQLIAVNNNFMKVANEKGCIKGNSNAHR